MDRALPSRRSQVDEEGTSGEDIHSRLQQEGERLRDALLAQEVRVRLEQVREEEEQGVQAPSLEHTSACEEAWREERHTLHRHAPCHKTKHVRRFVREHKALKTRLLPKRAPQLNPTEWIVNRPLKSVVCSNRSYRSMDEVDRNTTHFLRQHRTNLRT